MLELEQEKAAETTYYKYEISVVAPCYNEMSNVNALVDRIQATFSHKGLNGEIVLVNDASTDDTGIIINSLAEKYPNVTPVHHIKNKGISGAWKSGLDNCKGKYVCLIDADLQNLPEDIWRLYNEIDTSNVDFVQGYRSTIGRLKDSRYLYSRGLNLLLNRMFGMSLKDNKSGFVITHKDTLEDILQHRYSYSYFNTFIAIAAHTKGYTIKEVETLFQNRNLGKSYIASFPLTLITKVFIDIIKAVFEFKVQKDKHDIMYHFLRKNPPSKKATAYKGWRRVLFELFFMTMPLHKWLISANAKYFYKSLKQSEWLNAEQVKKLQELKLQKLIKHAYHHVPYYQNLFRQLNLKPEDIKTLEDLNKLPLLNKDDVRANLYFDLFADNHKKADMLKISTSGSTGKPFVTYADRIQLEMRWATTLRATEWTGWRFGDRQARLWHQTIGMSLSQVIREHVDACFMRRMFVPAFELRDDNLPKFIKKLKNYKPVFIDGYAESFNFLAHYLKHNSMDGFKPKAIMSSAQIMPPQVREIIEKQFGAKVYDKYGAREFSGIAYECEHHTGHHVMAESYIVEIIKDDRPALPGEVGEVVITDLTNFSVPLIRYRIGDLATAIDNSIPCSCGRGLPRIGRIEGRAQAIVLCQNNTWLPGTFFSHFFKEYDFAIKQYQIVQNEKESFDLKIVPGTQYDNQILTEMLNKLKTYTGESMKINVIEVDEIPLLRTGKRTGIISNLKFDFQALAGDISDR